MDLHAGKSLLRRRYELIREIDQPYAEAADSRTWLARGEYDSIYMVKVWPDDDQESDASRVRRALWDAELRTLYRACSSPGAEESLTAMREAGVDKENECLVMVLGAPGYNSLAEALKRERANYPWLCNASVEARRDLWLALLSLAEGLELLHEQHVLHTGVSPENVFFDPYLGAESMRLGGFEWSLRVGTDSARRPPRHWGDTPESAREGVRRYGLDSDWFGFGTLAIRCILDIEHFERNRPRHEELHRLTLERLTKEHRAITDLERDFLSRLIAREPHDRMTRFDDIVVVIREIIENLGSVAPGGARTAEYILLVNPDQTELRTAALDAGLRAELDLDSTTLFNPRDPKHASALTRFIERDLNAQGAQLYEVRNQKYFILVGDRLQLKIVPHQDWAAADGAPSWKKAYCQGTGFLRDGAHTTFPAGAISVFSSKNDLRKTARAAQLNASSWETRLPRTDRVAESRAELERFCQFVRATNQIELLFRDAEMFWYEIDEVEQDEGRMQITVRQVERERPVLSFLEMEKGLVEFLQRERENSTKPNSGQIELVPLGQDSLRSGGASDKSPWEISQVDVQSGRAVLSRTVLSGQQPPPKVGVLRSAGMSGQIRLIRRRKEAIDRLIGHTYLLRSLTNPGEVYMDTGDAQLPVSLGGKDLDPIKIAVIGDILRVRPIYALQGPPGTGKTTTVAWLLRQILADDPVAQILVTAQAHGAVDVLWSKVLDEAFADVPGDRLPLAVRLGGKTPADGVAQKGSVDEVAQRILENVIHALGDAEAGGSVQRQWLDACREMIGNAADGVDGAMLPDFRQLVKRGANLAFCTTSARDLEGLSGELSYDWSIVEEAGKVHGFDLALPLRAGHRWLLIGDQNQLPPYRIADYGDAVDQLGTVVDELAALPENAGGLLDREFVRTWNDWDEDERKDFVTYCKSWLKVFGTIFENCAYANSERGSKKTLTADKERGAAAGMLSAQHRMHPDIGTLVSEAYYEGNLTNGTVDEEGALIPAVRHPFIAPEEIVGKAVVWLDTKWSAAGVGAGEWGPRSASRQVPRYINPAEAHALINFLGTLEAGPGFAPQKPLKLAVLSPYTQQIGYLQRQRRKFRLPPGLEFAEGAQQKNGGFFTVDSFQGNQADVIAVSMVRNNKDGSARLPHSMGFLQEAERANVLLSRAERLLVIVGSWEFFVAQTSLIELDQRKRELWHWKRVVSTLSDWFELGRALRITADLDDYREPRVGDVLGDDRRAADR